MHHRRDARSLALLTLLLAVPARAGAQELLPDPSFEGGDVSVWQGHWGSVSAVNAEAAESGSFGYQLSLDSAATGFEQGGLFHTAPVTTGPRVRAQARFAQSPDDPLTGDVELELAIEFFDGGGNELGRPTRVTSVAGDPVGTFAMDFTVGIVPVGTESARFVVLLTRGSGSGGGTVFLDDISLMEVDATCGDRIPDAGEECEAAPFLSDTAPDTCRPSCALPRCGDDVVDTGETCDNGASNGFDSMCTLTCTPATGSGGDAGVMPDGGGGPIVVPANGGCVALPTGMDTGPSGLALFTLTFAALLTHVRRRRA